MALIYADSTSDAVCLNGIGQSLLTLQNKITLLGQ